MSFGKFDMFFSIYSNLTNFLYLLTFLKHPRSLITFIVSDNRLKRLTLQQKGFRKLTKCKNTVKEENGTKYNIKCPKHTTLNVLKLSHKKFESANFLKLCINLRNFQIVAKGQTFKSVDDILCTL